jgi:hypothetical protein
MSQFKISEQQYRKFRKRLLSIYIPFFCVIIAVIVVTNSYGKGGGEFPTWVIVIPVLLAYLGFILYRTLRRQQRIMSSYTITISESGITREQDSTPTISISFMEIKEIIKTKKGAFLVKGLGRTDLIGIPRSLNETGELERELQVLAPITTDKKDPLKMKYRWGLMLLAIALYICLYSVRNKVVIVGSGLLLSGLLGWSFYEIQRSKNVTTYTKRSSWIYLLIIASIVYMVYIKLTLPVF